MSLPLLPGRSVSLIDLGIFGGCAIVAVYYILQKFGLDRERNEPSIDGRVSPEALNARTWLFLIISWALVCVFAAEHLGVGLREWRVVFLSGGLFALLLYFGVQIRNRPKDRDLLINAWLAGATVVALIGLGQYATGKMVVAAEGVYRVRGLYGSPNI
ncbi:MAG: hypothetical protein HC802_01375, partial [Caldilineaceae bacterium]|nr:hypothetical protein [Caldilineaceae bacterium]